MAIEEGKPAPAFTLTDGGGKKVSLSDFKGKNVVLYFYPKDDTPGCTKEACGFRDTWGEIGKANAVVLGVSADDADSHTKFASKFNLPFPLLSDPDKEMMTEYDAVGERVIYGKPMKGILRSTVWIGPDGTVKKHWKRVGSVDTHAQEVLEALKGA
jgi:peroxiredoxin Q/BCP